MAEGPSSGANSTLWVVLDQFGNELTTPPCQPCGRSRCVRCRVWRELVRASEGRAVGFGVRRGRRASPGADRPARRWDDEVAGGVAPLDDEQALEVPAVHSVAAMLDEAPRWSPGRR